MTMSFAYAAPGKVILFGEHFVVHGARAVICAMDQGVVAESETKTDGVLSVHSALESADVYINRPIQSTSRILRPFHHIARSLDCNGATLRIRSDIPVGSGLGSSSACCVAAAGSLTAICMPDTGMNSTESISIMDVALGAERSVYPDSSGADCAACIHGGIISYMRGSFKTEAPPDDMRLVIADSGIRHDTSKMVGMVREMAVTKPGIFSALLADADTVSSKAIQLVSACDIPGLGRLASENQRLLERLGISNDTLRQMIQVADKHSYGSKITGAGGGGCIVAIADIYNAKATVDALTAGGYDAFEVRIGRGAGPIN